MCVFNPIQKQILRKVWEFAKCIQFYNQKEAQPQTSVCLVTTKARGNGVLMWLLTCHIWKSLFCISENFKHTKIG